MHHTMTLPNGARILTEEVPGVRTAALGYFVGTGSRHEGARECGAAHFIEHMSFKGTDTMDAVDLARETDAIGGQVNAYTTKESTCYYARCLDSHLDRATELLEGMLLRSRFDEGDVALERGVILEEIGMYEDTPEELCADRLAAAVYKGAALGRPILGKESTLVPMTGQWLRQWQRDHYGPERLVVSLTGRFDQRAVDRLAAGLAALPPGKPRRERETAYCPAYTARRKAIEQNHLMLAFPALSYLDPRRYQLMLLNAVLGGGASSRLFQELRERQGLCYSVYSYVSDHLDTGYLGIYTALGRETEERALAAACQIVGELAQHGPTQEELDRAREQAKANVIMGLESVQARMSHLGSATLLFGRVRTPDEILAEYDAVTRDQLRALSGELLDFSQASLSAVGRVDTAEGYRQRVEKLAMG